MAYKIYIDEFGVGLDELSSKDQTNKEKVIGILRKNKRFSCFEASANQRIAATMTALCKNRLTTIDLGYPWTGITHIDGKEI